MAEPSIEAQVHDLADRGAQLEIERLHRNDLVLARLITAGSSVIRFDSGLLTITAGGTISLNHGLGGPPDGVRAVLVCQIPQHGYDVGDEVEVQMALNDKAGFSNMGISLRTTFNQILGQIGDSPTAESFAVHQRTVDVGVLAGITNANWRLRIKAFRLLG